MLGLVGKWLKEFLMGKYINSYLSVQFLKFIFVGLTVLIINFLLRIILNLYFEYLLSVSIAALISIITAFYLNRIFVFKNSSKSLNAQIRSFIIINTFAFLFIIIFSELIYSLLLEYENIKYKKELAHFIAIIIPPMITFLFYKFSTFSKS